MMCVFVKLKVYKVPNFLFFFDKLWRRHKLVLFLSLSLSISIYIYIVENAQERGLIYRDKVHFDTHSAAFKEVAHLDTFTARQEARSISKASVICTTSSNAGADIDRHGVNFDTH